MSARLGTPRLHLQTVDSTSDRARAVAEAGAPHGAVVTADEQTAGRGRQGRAWASPRGTALLSMVVREPPELLTLMAAVAVAEVCGEVPVGIKWPNDVLLADGRKVAGILAERRLNDPWAVLGIGVNVAVDAGALPDEVRARAGSLGRARVEPFLKDLIAALSVWLPASDDAVLDAWRARDVLRGRTITWNGGSTGTAAGIDASGHLIVTLPDGTSTTLGAGEVHLGAQT